MSRSWLFLLVPFLFYLATAAPTIGLGDTALLVEAMEQGYLNSGVNNHNLTNATGWLFMRLPLGNLAFRGTLVSVVFGSLAIGILFLLFRSLMGDARPAALTAAAIMVSHSQWWHAALIECYAANAVFTALGLACLYWQSRDEEADRPLLVLFFLSGLGIFNHVQLGFLWCGGMVILIWKMVRLVRRGPGDAPNDGTPRGGMPPDRKPPEDASPGGTGFADGIRPAPGGWGPALRLFALSVVVFLIGFLPYAWVFGRDVARSGAFAATARAALGGDFQGLMFKGSLAQGLWDVVVLTGMQFPSPFLLLCLIGVWRTARRWGRSPIGWSLLTMYLVNTYFFALYNTWDKFAFLLPSFQITGFCGAIAVKEWWDRIASGTAHRLEKTLFIALFAVSLVFPPWFYSQLSIWGREPGFWYARYNNKHTVNSHDCAEYIANPDKHRFTDVEEFANLVFAKLPPNAIYLDDDGRCYYPLIYFQRYYGKRPDLSVQLVNCWGFDNWGASNQGFANLLRDAWESGRPLFLISLAHPFAGFLEHVPDRGRFVFERFPLDDRRWIYRLLPKNAPAGASGTPALPGLPTLNLQTPLNLRAIDVLADPGRFISQQEMLGFAGTWLAEDQVFVGFDGPAQIARITFQTDRPSSGSLRAGLTFAPDFGDFTVRLDGKVLANVISTWAPQVERREIPLGTCRLEAGEHQLEFEVAGKAPSGLGFRLGLDFLRLVP